MAPISFKKLVEPMRAISDYAVGLRQHPKMEVVQNKPMHKNDDSAVNCCEYLKKEVAWSTEMTTMQEVVANILERKLFEMI